MANSNYTVVSLPEVLALTFVILKLCNVITWSWWWVLSPLWISAGIIILALIILVIRDVIKNSKY